MALQFGPAEYFALGLLGLCCISAMTAKDHLKGVSAAILGLLLSTVGIDEITGAKRFDFGVPTLLGGVPFIPAVIGLFAASEVYRRVAVRDLTLVHGEGAKFQVRLPALADLLKLRWTILRSSFLGLGVGILPGAGATTAAILAYTAEVRLSKRPQDFGTGKIEGLAAPEAANNAAAVGAMIPLLSLGIPGSGTTAVLMGAFLIHNLTPGPFLFINHPELVYGLFSSIALANIVILILAVGFIHLFARLALLPYPMLATGILSISIIGSLAFGDLNAVMIMLVFALVGLALEAFDYPLAPVVLGLVLGPIVEFSLRRALLMSDFDFLVLVQRPITAVLLAVAIMFLTAPLWRLLWRHTFGSGASAADRQG
jgi:putative tricarboxylic transport membrane protein